MSRIGIKPITIPDGVTIQLADHQLSAHGPLGELNLTIPSDITVQVKDEQIMVTRPSDEQNLPALHGTVRSLINNIITGVNTGWLKKLELVGLGYRAAIEGDDIVLQVGFTHSVRLSIPKNLKTTIEKNVITVSGIDRQAVGQFAAIIRDVKPPEPYKGKGIRYQGEVVRMKQGKAAAKAGA
jgi:large subunit ribosomal protein L6